MSGPKADPPLLEVRELSAWRGRRQVLHRLSLSLWAGEVCVLVGSNGSGKSTLLETLIGSLKPTGGTVRVLGRDVAHCSRTDRAKIVALVGNETSRTLPLSARAVVEMGRLPHASCQGDPRRSDAEAVERALSEAACLVLAERLVFTLSDGERQRVHFARALAQEPRILLLDEAMAHMDLAHREAMLERVVRFTQSGGAALCVLHDLDLALRWCDRVAVLVDGHLHAAGDPRLLFESALLGSVFGVDAEVIEDAKGRNLRIYGTLGRERPARGRMSA